MKFLSRVILSRGKMVIIKKGKRDVWMSQMSLTRSHRPMVLYLKLVFCVGSRESGMWARQRRGSELPAEHSVSPLLCFLCRWAGSSSKENVHQVGQQALDEGRIFSCFPSFSYSVCVRTRMFFVCAWVLVHMEAMGLMSEIILDSSSILFTEAELIHTASLASWLALQIPRVCLLTL